MKININIAMLEGTLLTTEQKLQVINEKIEEERKKAQLEFVELLNHNKRKIFLNENRDVNEMFLDLEFLRGLCK